MSYTLFPWQPRGADMLERTSGVLNWEMRTGKTRTTLHAHNTRVNTGEARDMVVVGPSTALGVWPEEAEAMSLGLSFVRCYGTKDTTRRLVPDPSGWPDWMPRVYLINPEILPYWLGWFQDHLQVENFDLVADESHVYLRCATGQTQRYSAFDALSKGTDRVWELSGTWYVNSGLDVYWQLRPFGSGNNPFFYTKKACFKAPWADNRNERACGRCFACRYCHAIPNGFAQTGLSYTGIKNEGELWAKLPNVLALRESDIREIALPDRFPVWVGEGDADWPDQDLPDSVIDAEQQALVPAKIKLTQAYLAQLRAGELAYVERPDRPLAEWHEPVVIFGWHRAYTEGLARVLGCPVITGDTSVRDRDQIRRDFATGKVPVLVGNLQSAGLGIDLSAARWFLYGEPRRDAALHYQAEARGRGPKQRAKTLRHAYLLIRGSVDATIWKHRLHRGDDIERFYTAGRDAGREAGGRYLEESR